MSAMHIPLRTARLFAFIFVGFAAMMWAQAPAKRLVRVSITDPMGRSVTGLDGTSVGIVEDGVRRPITKFTELTGEYQIEFEAVNRAGEVKVLIEQIRGLPPLRANLKK